MRWMWLLLVLSGSQVAKQLPYVLASPPMDTPLRGDDWVFVLAQETPYGAWVQTME